MEPPGGGVVTGRAAWSALTTGLALFGGAVATLVYARWGWHPRDPFALVGAFVLGGFAGLGVSAFAATEAARFDRVMGLHPDVADEAMEPDDLLWLARAAGVTKGGAR